MAQTRPSGKFFQQSRSQCATTCGRQTPIVPTLHVTRLPDLFITMNEGELDLFVSPMSGTIPAPIRQVYGFLLPLFHQEGIGTIIQKPEATEQLWCQFRA